jgi:hypothetical protein
MNLIKPSVSFSFFEEADPRGRTSPGGKDIKLFVPATLTLEQNKLVFALGKFFQAYSIFSSLTVAFSSGSRCLRLTCL